MRLRGHLDYTVIGNDCHYLNGGNRRYLAVGPLDDEGPLATQPGRTPRFSWMAAMCASWVVAGDQSERLLWVDLGRRLANRRMALVAPLSVTEQRRERGGQRSLAQITQAP